MRGGGVAKRRKSLNINVTTSASAKLLNYSLRDSINGLLALRFGNKRHVTRRITSPLWWRMQTIPRQHCAVAVGNLCINLQPLTTLAAAETHRKQQLGLAVTKT